MWHCGWRLSKPVSTHPLTRPTFAVQKRLRAERDRAAVTAATLPDPDAWFALLCERCTRFFRTQGIKRHCVRCISEAAKRGVVGSEFIGEVSGS